jgi:hypothetical protein
MALSDRRFVGIRQMAGALLLATLFAAASALTLYSSATAAPDRHVGGHPGAMRGHGGPGYYGAGHFRGRGWYGGGRWYGGLWRGYGYPGYGYYGRPYLPYGYVQYYFPQYYYPQYVMPTAVYMTPPPPVAAVPSPPREFTVYFDFDQYNLTADGRRVVDAAIAASRAGGPARIDVTGNTDLAGTNRYNLVLSRHRAQTVRDYLVAHGVDPGEIGINALGKTDPAVRTADGVREPRNRRVEIVVTPLRGAAPPATSMSRPPAYRGPVNPAGATMTPPPGPVSQPTNLINQ